MNVDEVKAMVDEIREMAHDDEGAHVAEDGLYQSVLRAIAEGRCADPEAVAREALKAADIGFSRWYA